MQCRSVWFTVVLLAALAACGPREVRITVAIPGLDSVDTPVAGVPVIALPYDRDSIIKALEAQAGTPRPQTQALDTLFRRFQAPFLAYALTSQRADSLQGALSGLRARLDSLQRSDSTYRLVYARYVELADSLERAQRRRDSAHAALQRARQTLGPRMDSLRELVRQWEDSTYRSYDSITRSLGRGLGREPQSDTTDATGNASLRLSKGRWWIYAKSWDAHDPNAQWYWNVPVQGDSVRLDSRTGVRKPRY